MFQQVLGKRRAILNEPDEISAAGDEGELGIESVRSDRFSRVICSRNGKWVHSQLLAATSATASTMFG